MTATYIFMDVDGVLIHGYAYNPKHRRAWDEHIERDLGIAPGALQEHLFTPHSHDISSGKRDLVETLTEILPTLNFQGTAQEVIDYWFRADSVLDTDLLALLAEVKSKSHAQLYLATNQESGRADYLWNELKLSSLFTDSFYSGKIGYSKPQPEFFAHVNDDLALDPEKHEILFFDDNPANIAAAKHAGWLAFLYETIEDFAGNAYIVRLLSNG